TTSVNPFPGLRPFRFEESHLFFGRENQVDRVIDKLINRKFVAIVGASGVGKSSFMSCGILPVLMGDYKTEDASAWEIYEMTPGDSPIQSLTNALSGYYLGQQDKPELDDVEWNVNYSTLSEYTDGLVKIIKNKYEAEKKNYLLFIDQFEELFRFTLNNAEAQHTDEVNAFVKLVVHAINQTEVPIYIVTTIRSDFIGDCAQYPSLTEVINESQFLIPQMTREEKQSAIVGPISVMGAQIEDRLVQEILNDIGDSSDQLPIMQHALMRTWSYWQVNSVGSEPISLTDYEAVGRMQNALSEHAREAYRELNDEEKKICERIFKTITEKGEEGRGVRRPTKLSEIAAIVNAPEDEIREVVEHFRKPGRTLLLPADGELQENTMIDISHESFMRIWVELNEWVEEEAESVKLYLRLAEAAEMHQEGKAGLWRPPDLQIALSWRDEQKPSLAWGLRHHKAYERTMLFLEYSQKEYEREQIIREKLQKRRLVAARITAVVLGLGIVVALLFLLYAERQRREADIQRAEAAKQKETAEQQAQIAKLNEQEAIQQKQIAETEKERAVKNEQIATQQRQIAETERQNAIIQTVIADSARRVAMTEEQKAYQLRLLSIAKSMAIKSVQLTDSAKKGLVAKQAFDFYRDNGGRPFDPDIYDGLYYAVKSLEHPDYNSLIAHTQNVRSIVTSKNARYIYSAGSDGKILRWDGNDPQSSHEVISDRPGRINRTLAVSNDNRFLACGGEFGYLEIYDLNDLKKKPRVMPIDVAEVWYLEFANNNFGIIYAGSDKRITYQDFDRKEVIAESDEKINAIAISPDGKFVAAAKSNGMLNVIDLGDNNSSSTYFQDSRATALISVAFSNNGRYLATGDEKGKVHVWDFKSNRLLSTLTGHSARVNNIEFSHNNKRLATGSFDKTVRIWNVDNLFDAPIVLKDHEDWVWSIAFSPDDTDLLAGCRDYLIRLWPTNTQKMATKVCEQLNRNMSTDEWELFVAEDIPYEITCK
ncbi:High-affnity carbon uptake protein Hat/HatR, partial [Fulvivirga sp. RKSG066]|uniref:nSTAND1 domain-containing NTPase n=1 Tax=Fulvivirga aurantia TaxID=2529383 RepID=UPI0012BC919C